MEEGEPTKQNQVKIMFSSKIFLLQEQNGYNNWDTRAKMQLSEQDISATTTTSNNPIKIKTSYRWCAALGFDLFFLPFYGSGCFLLYQTIVYPDLFGVIFLLFWLPMSIFGHISAMFEGSKNSNYPGAAQQGSKGKPLESLEQLYNHFQELRNTNSIKITPSLFIPQSNIENETPSLSLDSLQRYPIVLAEYKLNLKFANDQSRIKYDEMADGKLQRINGNFVSAEVASESNRFLWKSNQAYANFKYARRCVFWSYVILSFVCLDWLVELYVNLRRLVVQCEITITKSFNIQEALRLLHNHF